MNTGIFRKPKRFLVWRTITISDYSHTYPDVVAGPGVRLATLTIYGTFWIDGVCYGRAKPPGDTEFVSAYGVPFDDPETGEPNIGEQEIYHTEVTPEERQALKTNHAEVTAVMRRLKQRHRLQYVASTIEKHTENLLTRINNRPKG